MSFASTPNSVLGRWNHFLYRSNALACELLDRSLFVGEGCPRWTWLPNAKTLDTRDSESTLSDEDDNAENALTNLGIAPAAKELYLDLLRPAAAEMGRNLVVVAKLVSHALTPLRAAVWGLDRISDWLSTALLRRLAKVEPEQIQSPPLHVAGQILLQLPFCADQERLREMYANLLAASMIRRAAIDVHPAFVHVVQQLSPDEALLLQRIAREGTRFNLKEVLDEDGDPRGGTSRIEEQFKDVCEKAGVGAAGLSDAYLDNLLRLKIFVEIHWSEGELHAAGWNYHGEYGASVANYGSRLVQLSAFGERFLKTCVVDLGGQEAAGV